MSDRIKFKDVRHIVHVAVVILVVIVAFVVARFLSVPKSFGQYGHYRGKSIDERMTLDGRKPLILFQGAEVCKECHEEERGKMWVGYETWQEGKHSSNTCQNCHSNCSQHVERMKAQPDSKEFLVTKNTANELCLTCHGCLAARPTVVKLFDAEKHKKEHNMEEGNKCIQCHVPHYPAL